MLVDLQTAAPCDRLLSLLWDSYDVYQHEDEIDSEDDPDSQCIMRLARVLDNLAHEVWVPGYVTPADRDIIDENIRECALTARRKLGRGGHEIVTRAVTERVLENARVKFYEEHIDDRGDGHPLVHNYRRGMAQDTFEVVAREAMFDCDLRMDTPSFELRVCVHDGEYFIPKRAGRGRFCRDSCRSAFAVRDELFTCAFCGRRRPHRAYSGLILAPEQRNENRVFFGQEYEPPRDLRMSKYQPHYDLFRVRDSELADRYSNQSVCTDCVVEHRPAWARYVVAAADTLTRERIS